MHAHCCDCAPLQRKDEGHDGPSYVRTRFPSPTGVKCSGSNVTPEPPARLVKHQAGNTDEHFSIPKAYAVFRNCVE